MGTLNVALLPTLQRIGPARLLLYALATAAVFYMYGEAHAEGVRLAHLNGFGSDFHGTIWAPDHSILHGRSPYPSASRPFRNEPAVYLPPIFIATAYLGALSLHVAMWVWFGALMAAAVAVPACLGVRDPWCYALTILALPVVDALVLGNATILVALGAALTWRYRDHRIAGPLALAATVSIKLWLWPLLAWMVFTRPRSGIRSITLLVTITFVAWGLIGFHGLTGYPALGHTEARLFARAGTLFVAALIQVNVAVSLAAALGFLGGVLLIALAISRRSSDIESFSLTLLAALVATPVGWPHYLILMFLPIAILWPTISLAWAWAPGTWIALHFARDHGPAGSSIALSLLATIPVVLVMVRRRLERAHALPRAL